MTPRIDLIIVVLLGIFQVLHEFSYRLVRIACGGHVVIHFLWNGRREMNLFHSSGNLLILLSFATEIVRRWLITWASDGTSLVLNMSYGVELRPLQPWDLPTLRRWRNQDEVRLQMVVTTATILFAVLSCFFRFNYFYYVYDVLVDFLRLLLALLKLPLKGLSKSLPVE